ncbi:acyl-CoA synthetase [Myxococcus landrumensis]|uniref:Acyl-CoA synthetase n=1 Tax=Myxococcus landrumensis TaxID=2813577 RepID=A0ABX7NFC6_9BACT|nr:acyl-CoA synthetase [Myxococcus landrumus]QSQ14993.1 acyl-CoA synthetase [Myxococcus landrumus]
MTFNLADLFESLVDIMPERLAAVAGDHRLTFQQLDARANRLANALHEHGVRAGDHVGLYLHNGIEFLECLIGLFKLRAVPININYRYVESELEFLMKDANLTALVHGYELSATVIAAARNVPSLRLRVGVGGGGEVEYEQLLAASSPERHFEARSGDDLYILYTGGTTGMPRGVMWRHEDVLFAGLQGGNPGGPPIDRPEALAPLARDRPAPMVLLTAAPFVHGTAQWAAFIALFSGGTAVIVPSRSYEPHRVCQAIQSEKVNTLVIVGDAMARPLAEALAQARASGTPHDLSCLRVISSSGAFLSPTVRQQLQEQLPDTLILDNFGATEAGHQGTAFSSGEVVAFYMDESSAVLGEDLRPVQPGAGVIGRLARRGRLPLGYYNDPEKTAATFLVIDGVRWVLPGDLATVEKDGRITVLGRGAVCINSGGEKVFPEEVEAALKAHPAIRDAVVVGVPDVHWGERVTAVIEPRPDHRISLEVLGEHCRTLLSGYKVPRQLRVVDHIVRHPSGKPDYRWARNAATEERA